MGIPRKDALLKAKSDVSDPRTTAEMNRVVKEAVKESVMESAKDNMESMEGVSKSIKEGMSEGFRAISESMKEAMQEIVSRIEIIKNREPSPESQHTLPPAQHKFQQENFTQENSVIKPIETNSQMDCATGSEPNQE